ncbi:MAG: GGDEF domain-containing protein [Tepidisphaerales bacterium]
MTPTAPIPRPSIAGTEHRPTHDSTPADVLLVGDTAQLEPALREATGPGVTVTTCPSWFDAIGHLSRTPARAVFLPASAVTRRPDAAMAALLDAAGLTLPGVPSTAPPRLVAVAAPAHEGLCRRLVQLGCHDYLILPAGPRDVQVVLAPAPGHAPTPPLRVAAGPAQAPPAHAATPVAHGATPVAHGATVGLPSGAVAPPPSAFDRVTPVVAELLLDALYREPADAARAALRELNARLPAGARLELLEVTDPDPVVPPGMTLLSRLLRSRHTVGDAAAIDAPLPAAIATPTPAEAAAPPSEPPLAVLHLFLSPPLDGVAADPFLDHLSTQLTRLLELQHRHRRLQTLAITDELTGLYNARYFKHFLQRTLVKAKQGRFPVTLLLFDIDGFKTYNDTYGHAVGDEILRQTARMIRRCVRDHDLVARLGGDEFAVVFWEKDGPRQALHAPPDKPVSHRPPQSPVQVFERFKRLIASHDFAALGPNGRGTLTISGGLAVYPYDAQTADELIAAADNALMFGAKRSGKNTIHLVGQSDAGQ